VVLVVLEQEPQEAQALLGKVSLGVNQAVVLVVQLVILVVAVVVPGK
jgi:hypothetical protein